MFSLGLVWNHWGPGLVADLLGMLSPVVDLDVVFSRGPQHGIPGVGAGAGEVSAGKVRVCVRPGSLRMDEACDGKGVGNGVDTPGMEC